METRLNLTTLVVFNFIIVSFCCKRSEQQHIPDGFRVVLPRHARKLRDCLGGTVAQDFKPRIHVQFSHVLLVFQRNKQLDSEDKQHFCMEFMPEVLFQAVRFRRDNIFAWSLCQKYCLVLGDRSAMRLE